MPLLLPKAVRLTSPTAKALAQRLARSGLASVVSWIPRTSWDESETDNYAQLALHATEKQQLDQISHPLRQREYVYSRWCARNAASDAVAEAARLNNLADHHDWPSLCDPRDVWLESQHALTQLPTDEATAQFAAAVSVAAPSASWPLKTVGADAQHSKKPRVRFSDAAIESLAPHGVEEGHVNVTLSHDSAHSMVWTTVRTQGGDHHDSIGVDICCVRRVQSTLERYPQLASRCFNAGDVQALQHLVGRYTPVGSSLGTGMTDLSSPLDADEPQSLAAPLAVGWAAKEAVIKATSHLARVGPLSIALKMPKRPFVYQNGNRVAVPSLIARVNLGHTTQRNSNNLHNDVHAKDNLMNFDVYLDFLPRVGAVAAFALPAQLLEATRDGEDGDHTEDTQQKNIYEPTPPVIQDFGRLLRSCSDLLSGSKMDVQQYEIMRRRTRSMFF